ncbi:MAG: DnaD domain protein [Oscillospiraceae bacterium]|nr:DnaD domain protein [Oscillospiraceae bacterium]
MNYNLNAGCWESVFAVPGAVVDNYIKLASGSAVKVLLYILKNNSRDVSRSEISSALNISEDDVSDAFNFWEEVNIINKSQKTADNTPEHTESKAVTPKSDPVISAEVSANPKVKAQVQTSSASFQITPKEAERLKQSSHEIRALFDMAQQILGNVINHTTIRSLVWQHEYLGLKADVILMILSYCAETGKTHTAYIEAIAVNWSQNEINTLAKAQDEIERLKKSNTYNAKLMAAFGLKRQPTPNQQKFFDEWRLKGYSADLVACACERTADLGKTMTANYVNGILENWHKKGITTREQALAETKNGKFSSGGNGIRKEQSYDINEFENFAITFSKNTKKDF